jgi:tetratricopeptide (TPR) repeat protein
MKDKKEFEQENEIEFPGMKKDERKSIEKFQEFVERNSKRIMIASIAVIAIVFIIYKVSDYYAEKNAQAKQDASLALSRLEPYMETLDYEHALYGDSTKKIRNEEIIGLIKIVEKYEDTPQGRIAALYAGDCFSGLKKYKDAQHYYELAINAADNNVLSGANAGLGVCSEIEGKTEEAIKYYEKASELALTPETKNRYQVFAAILLESTNKEKAEAIYRDIIGEGVSPEYVANAKAGLVRMGKSLE